MQRTLLVLVLSCASCRMVETHSVSSVPPTSVRVGALARTWEVRRGGEHLGQVVLFQERGLAGDCVYVVRNAWSQDLGLIDGLGRAFRYLPHMEEPAWVGSGTIALGAERILGAEGCTLVEVGGGPELEAPEAVPEARVSADRTALEPSALPSNAPLADGGLPQSR